MIGSPRIFPKKFLCGIGSFAPDPFRGYVMDGGVRRYEIAYGPIAAKHHAFSAEEVKNKVQYREIERRVVRQMSIGLAGDIGNLGINVWQTGDFLKCLAHGGRFCLPVSERKVIQDQTQVRREFCHAQHVGQYGRTTHNIQAKLTFGEGFDVRFEGALAKIFRQHVQIESQSAEQGICAKAFQIHGKLRLTRIEVADETDNDRIVPGKVKHPLIVLQPGAGFDHHDPDDAQSFRQFAEIFRQMGFVQRLNIFGRPRNALWSCGIIEVDVGINCGNRTDG